MEFPVPALVSIVGALCVAKGALQDSLPHAFWDRGPSAPAATTLTFTLGPAPSVGCSQGHLWSSVKVYSGLTGLLSGSSALNPDCPHSDAMMASGKETLWLKLLPHPLACR